MVNKIERILPVLKYKGFYLYFTGCTASGKENRKNFTSTLQAVQLVLNKIENFTSSLQAVQLLANKIERILPVLKYKEFYLYFTGCTTSGKENRNNFTSTLQAVQPVVIKIDRILPLLYGLYN